VFITFEGIEGCGKSTQLVRLAEALRRHGWRVTVTREPGGTRAGERIRGLLVDASTPALDPFAELLLYLADRTQHVREIIIPALADGQVVLCDRFSDSTIAYQGYGRGGDLSLIRRLDETARGGCRPDLTFLLDCPVALGLERARRRAGEAGRQDPLEREPEAFHERVQAGFTALAHADPQRFVIVDTRLPMQETEARILAEALRRLAAGGSP
jgi:dTMP kinase